MPPPAGTTIAKAFQREFMGQAAHQDFQVISLWELEAEQVLAYDNPALLPFVPLMQGGNTEQMVRRCADRIRREPKALELETILSVFAGYVLETELIKQILRWEMEVIKESPIIQELYQLGFEEGREKGREEGQRKAILEVLYQILAIRFDVGLGEFEKRFERLDLESLKRLNEAALTAQTLVEFENTLADVLSNVATT